uniref:Uncharacterized protein n=1 Tax=Pyxicephalus adspersus TaxID=30357 RepID=A0AAV3AAA1_PYXAD|nr:TPA: hypothetical protein GDO54_016969 [Pyxicephalus adspersus]
MMKRQRINIPVHHTLMDFYKRIYLVHGSCRYWKSTKQRSVRVFGRVLKVVVVCLLTILLLKSESINKNAQQVRYQSKCFIFTCFYSEINAVW